MAIDHERVQDDLLNHYRKYGTRIRVHLINGESFDGAVKSFDAQTIKLAAPEPLLLMKTTIATIEPVPARAKAKVHKHHAVETPRTTTSSAAPIIERKRRRIPVIDRG